MVHTFTTPGSIPIQVTHSLNGNLSAASTTINVLAPPVIESPVCVVGHFREVTIPAFPPGVTLQLDNRVQIRETTSNTDGSQLNILRLNTLEDRPSVFRIYGQSGPIVGTLPIRSMRTRSAGETTVLLTEDMGNNTHSYMMPVILNGLHGDVSAQFDIFIFGVVFDDGSLTKILKIADDFTLDGVAVLNFIKTGTVGANCHRTSLWQTGKRIAYFQ